MRYRSTLSLAAAILLGLLAGPTAPVAAKGEPRAPATVHVLENGLKLILEEDHRLPLVAVSVFYRVGSAHEPAGRSGFAHLFEHLMFTGTERVPDGGFDEILEASGAWSNASTAEDYTEYHEVGPAHLLPTMLWLEADRMEALGGAVTQEKLDVQRDVVRNERREGYDNAPYGKAEIVLFERLYPRGHPYHEHVIGSHEDLQKASLEDVQSFFARTYVPSNASIAIVGDFDAEPTIALVERLFGSLPRGEALPAGPPRPATLERAVRVSLPDDVRLPRITYAWHTPAFYAEGDADLDLLAAVLADGKSSRLWWRLVHEEAIATEVVAWQESRRYGSIFRLDVQVADIEHLDRVEEVVREELQTMRTTEVSGEEVDRARAGYLHDELSMRQGLVERAELLNLYDTYLGDPNRLTWDLDRYRRVNPATLRNAARLLDPARGLTMVVRPRSAVSTRATRPADEVPRTFVAPTPETFRLANGLAVWLLRRDTVPLVAARLVFPGGTRGSGGESSGLPAIAARMLTEGAGERTAFEYARALADLGTRVGVHYGRADITLNMQVLGVHIDPALGLLAEAVARPRFDEASYEDLRGRHASWVRMALDEPDRLARELGPRAWLTDVAPAYGAAIEGAPSAILATPREAARAYADEHFGPDGAYLLLAGDLGLDEAKRLVTKHFGAWRGTARSAGTPPRADARAARLDRAHRVRKVIVVDRPEAEQTQVRFVLPAPAWEDADRVPASVVASVLGGAFTSRLMQVLREEHGYTYGSYARYVPLAGVGYLDLDAAVETSVTGQALDALLDVVEGIGAGDVTDAEAKKAVATLLAERVTAMQTLGGMLDELEHAAVFGGDPDGLAKEVAALERPTTANGDRLNAVARRWIRPREGVIVLVGDRRSIEGQLEGLGLPSPLFLTAEEALER